MAKSIWVIFNSLCRLSCLQPVFIRPHWDLQVYQLYELAICTTWQDGIERWQLMSNTWLIYWCAFFGYQSKLLWHKQHEIWLKCLHQGQIYWQWPVPLVSGSLQFSSKSFALHFLQVTYQHMRRNEIFGTWAIAIHFLWLFPYIQDRTKF